MKPSIHTLNITASFEVHTSRQVLSVEEDCTSVSVASPSASIQYDKEAEVAQVQLRWLETSHTFEGTLNELCDLRDALAEWAATSVSLIHTHPIDHVTFVTAVWEKIEAAVAEKMTKLVEMATYVQHSQLRANWLNNLPNGTPLLVTDFENEFYSDGNEDDEVSYVLILQTDQNGGRLLTWPHGGEYRLLDADETDNHLDLATSEELVGVQLSGCLMTPEPERASLAEIAEAVAITHGRSPAPPLIPEMILSGIPDKAEWLSKYYERLIAANPNLTPTNR